MARSSGARSAARWSASACARSPTRTAMLSPNRPALPSASSSTWSWLALAWTDGRPRRDGGLVHDVVVHECEHVQEFQCGAHGDDVGPALVVAAGREPPEMTHGRTDPLAAALEEIAQQVRQIGRAQDVERTVVVDLGRPYAGQVGEDTVESAVELVQEGRSHRRRRCARLEPDVTSVRCPRRWTPTLVRAYSSLGRDGSTLTSLGDLPAAVEPGRPPTD